MNKQTEANHIANEESNEENNNRNYKLRDAADNNGIVPDDALQKVNPAAAERATPDHDPHNVVKDHKQYDTNLTEVDGNK